MIWWSFATSSIQATITELKNDFEMVFIFYFESVYS